MKKVDVLCTQWFCPFKHICLRATTKPYQENQKYADFQYKREWKHGDKPLDICKNFVSSYSVKIEEGIQKELEKPGANKQLEQATIEHYNNFDTTEFFNSLFDLRNSKSTKINVYFKSKLEEQERKRINKKITTDLNNRRTMSYCYIE